MHGDMLGLYVIHALQGCMEEGVWRKGYGIVHAVGVSIRWDFTSSE